MNTPRYYYANEQNQPIGPFTVDELTKLQEQVLVTNATLICVEDGSDWIPLTQVTGGSQPPPATKPSTPSSPQQPSSDSRTSYQKTAETVGMIPDMSGKRNLLQLVITFPIALVFLIWGLFKVSIIGALAYGFGGIIVGVIVSGTVLMVLGWKKDS